LIKKLKSLKIGAENTRDINPSEYRYLPRPSTCMTPNKKHETLATPKRCSTLKNKDDNEISKRDSEELKERSENKSASKSYMSHTQ